MEAPQLQQNFDPETSLRPPHLQRTASQDSYNSSHSRTLFKKRKDKTEKKPKKPKKDKKKKAKDRAHFQDQDVAAVQVRDIPVVPRSFERKEDDEDDSDEDYSVHSRVSEAIFQLGANGFSALEKMYDEYLTG